MPAKLRIKLAVPDADMSKYRSQIKMIMEKENKNAVRKWLKSVLRKTPTYTGTARGTYAPIGRVVGYAVRRGQSTATSNPSKKKYFIYNGKKYKLGFGAGAQYQEHKFQTRAYKDKVTSLFVFDQKLPYVLWNEKYPAPVWMNLIRPTPWFALKAGRVSYENHFRRHVYKRLGAVKLVIGQKVVKSA